jgi:hypothetical protein
LEERAKNSTSYGSHCHAYEVAARKLREALAATPAVDIPPCPKCHAPYHLEGAERYWEARWRDEKAENERIRAAAPAVGGEREALADKLDAYAALYASDYGYAIASDLKNAAAALRVQPASPLRGREDIAAVLYMKRFPHRTWLSASLTETALSYEQADAVLTLFSASPPEQPAAAPIEGQKKLSDNELWSHGCMTRWQVEHFTDDDIAKHSAGMRHTVKFLLARLDALSAQPPNTSGSPVWADNYKSNDRDIEPLTEAERFTGSFTND